MHRFLAGDAVSVPEPNRTEVGPLLYKGCQSEANKADPSEADLSKANLSGADLRYADLVRTQLNDATLNGANLFLAKLHGANLQDAYLSGVELIEAELDDANLREVHLGAAALSRADLSQADLSKANLSEADLSGADLSGSRLIRYSSPSLRRGRLQRSGSPVRVISSLPLGQVSPRAQGSVPPQLGSGRPHQPRHLTAWLRSRRRPDGNHTPSPPQPSPRCRSCRFPCLAPARNLTISEWRGPYSRQNAYHSPVEARQWPKHLP
jgi:hypothetical protein